MMRIIEGWAEDETYTWHYIHEQMGQDFRGRDTAPRAFPACTTFTGKMGRPGDLPDGVIVCPECREVATRKVVERVEKIDE